MSATYRPVFEHLRPKTDDKPTFYNPENDDERILIIQALRKELGPDNGIREENGLFTIDIQYMEELHVINMIEEMVGDDEKHEFARMLRFKTVEVKYNDALLADDKGNKERLKAFQQQQRVVKNKIND
jgi:hypothetical protein